MLDCATQPDDLFTRRLRVFKLIFVPVLILSLAGQIAVVWTQFSYIRDGYFDFILYHSAARIVADGRGEQLYDPGLQQKYQKDFRVAPSIRSLPFNHLPYELLLFLPLAQLNFSEAQTIWLALNLLLTVAMAWRWSDYVTNVPPGLLTLMTLAFFPALTTLKMGQDSLITTSILVETFINFKQRRFTVAGGILALGIYKPQLILPFAGILLGAGYWRTVGGFVAVSVLLAVVSLFMVGWHGLAGLLALWSPMTDRGNVVWPELMLNLRGLVYMTLDVFGGTGMTNIIVLIASVIVFLLTLVCWRRVGSESSNRFELQFALATTMTALVSFHLYSYDGMLLLIPLALTLNYVLRGRLMSLRHRFFLALLIVFFLPLVPNVLLSHAVLAWWALPLPILFTFLLLEVGGSTNVSPSGKV
jgi:hypothetical protein